MVINEPVIRLLATCNFLKSRPLPEFKPKTIKSPTVN